MSNNIVKPYSIDGSKKEQVAKMFDNISQKYDFLNHFLSMGMDILWRKKAVKYLSQIKPQIILDIATGTGDFAIEAAKLKPQKIIGIDISEGMLQIGKEKMKKKGLSHIVTMMKGDSENLPFENHYADAITIGFGVRNFENLNKGLSEIYRVLKPGGMVVILEPAIPTKFPMRQIFHLYFKKILPTLGKWFSKDSFAYSYLPKSVEAFPNGHEFLNICHQHQFNKTQWIPLTLGICSMYILRK
jgi:demethylmenaquinone methyltransferase/2-methoxy-6-polyprenyl-1,4-benzoquinol methylase